MLPAFPTGTTTKNYHDLCTDGTKIDHLDGAFYTNHSFAMYTGSSSNDLVFNGCLVSRNEDIIYGTNHCIFNFDYRLLDPSASYGLYLPVVWNPVSIVYWNAP